MIRRKDGRKEGRKVMIKRKEGGDDKREGRKEVMIKRKEGRR